MERRASTRRPIQLKAQLGVGKLPIQPCVISDFCAEGLFLQYGPAVTQAMQHLDEEPPAVHGEVSFVEPGQGPEYRLQVQVVRLTEGAMGVMFTHANAAAVAAMLKLCGADDLQPAAVIGQTPSVAFVLRQCARSLQQRLQPLFEQYLQEAPAMLVAAAETASNDKLRGSLLDAETLFRNQASRLQEVYLQQVTAPLLSGEPREQRSLQSAPQVSELSLIEKNEFEDWLTVKVMITKAETQYRAALLQLKMRLDKVGVISQLGYQNPLGPPLLCYAFRDTILPLRLPQATEKLCYRLFEKTVLKQLDEVYDDLNNLLIRQGILPNLDLSKYLAQKTEPTAAAKQEPSATKLEPSAAKLEPSATKLGSLANKSEPSASRPEPSVNKLEPSVKPAPPPEAKVGMQATAPKSPRMAPAAETEKGAIKPRAGELSKSLAESSAQIQDQLQFAQSAYSTVCNLFSVLERGRQGGKTVPLATAAAAKEDPKTLWSYEDVQQSLASVQQTARQSDTASKLQEPPLRKRLESTLQRSHKGEQKRLPKEQRQALDVVDQFFASLLKSGRVTETAKGQIKHLEIPLLRLLMRDRAAFDSRKSPIHTLINRIAQVGVKGGRPNAANNERINRLVTRVLEESERDPAVLDEAVAELNDMLERQNLVFRRNVERVTAAAEGAQKVDDAKLVVSREINRRIAGKAVPRAILSLINGGWRDLLSLTYIRQGLDSPAWRNYCGVLDTLLAIADNPDFIFNLPDLVQIIQEGLSSISSNHIPSGNIRDELKRFLTARASDSIERVEVPEQPEDDAQQELRMLSDSRRRGMQRWVARVQKLKVGEWLRLQRPEDNEPQFIRLAWVGKDFSRFVFVNHQGMKVVDWDQFKLASFLQRGVAVPEPAHDLPIFDQSLDAMVKDVYDQLSFATTHDEVTGLINRKEFERNLESALVSASAERHFSLIYLDLRQFKIVNDSAGYEAGDQLLKDVAGLLAKQSPPGAILARLGGNEFGVLVAEADAQALAQQYLKAIQGYRLLWQERQFSVSLNLGIAESRDFPSDTANFLKSAESACRKAKAEGSNRVELFHPNQQEQSKQEQIVAKVASLGGDLKSERMLLRCQKIIPLKPDTRVGAQHEILLSIYDDSGSLIPAADFVRMAERYNRMQVVDRWVVGHMLDWMAQNRNKIQSMGCVSINLSGHSLNDEELLEFIFERLTKTDSPIDRVCFEITEAAAIANIQDVAEFMEELREYGCRFCLGNFGAGMSSYQFLKTLPVDLIKIDGSFIKNLVQDANDQMMVRSMAEMVHFMGKELIATQVETKACLDLLAALNVDYAQGFFIEKPRLLAGF